MPSQVSAYSRASGNPEAGSPLSRGRAIGIGLGVAAAFFTAALFPLSLRAAEPDLAFGAFQTGHYLTAFGIATNRVELKKDPKAMTLLGELYSEGLGVPRDDNLAAEWFRRAANGGDREAMFELSVFRMTGRAGPRNSE